jgi:membrane protein DedA with SNARE-associated domain
MPAWLEGRPFAVTVLVLFLIVLARAQATYWAGRGAMSGALHTSFRRRLTAPRMTRAIARLNRWGLPLVTISFITIGFQTVINAAAGLTRMHWGRYTAAMLPGCVAWAQIYATVGFTALTAWLRLDGAWQWVALAALVAVIATGIAIAVHVKRRLTAASGAATDLPPANAVDSD